MQTQNTREVTREHTSSEPGTRDRGRDVARGHRVMLIGIPFTFLEGDKVTETPADAFTGGLAGLLGRMQVAMPEGGVIVLDGRACRQLGLPTRPDQLDVEGDADHEVLTGPRNAGWSAARLMPWTTFYGADRPRITVGALPLLDPSDDPVAGMPTDTVEALVRFHDAVGVPYRGHSGISGIDAIIETIATTKTKKPDFRPKEHAPLEANELPFLPDQFQGPWPKTFPYRAAYDARMGYLAAFAAVRLASQGLRYSRTTQYDGTRAGWWQVEVAPWQDRRMPDPAGYDPASDGQKRWLTGPTLDLLDQLAGDGIHGGYEVIQSWSAPILASGNGRPLKPWSDRIRDALYGDFGLTPGGDVARVAVKAVYRETMGMLGTERSWVYRPDWRAAVISQFRSNLWRRMWKVGNKLDRWPVLIDTDEVWYPIESDDAVGNVPGWVENGKADGIVLGDRLGQFQVKKAPVARVQRGASA